MVDRIVLSPSTSLKVSRPGVDVLSTSNPADLLIGGDWETMGVYATGFVSGVENVFPGKVGYTRRVRMVLPNPTGRIPFVICQGIWSADESRGTTADGNWELFRELANESPVVWYTYAVGVYEQLSYSTGTNTIECFTSGFPTNDIRYVAFYPRSGEQVYAAADQLPDPFYFNGHVLTASEDGASSEITISGLSEDISTFLRVNCNFPGDTWYQRRVIVESTSPSRTVTAIFPNGQYDVWVEVQNGDRFRISQSSTSYAGLTYTIYNQPADVTTQLGQIQILTKYVDSTPDPVDWTNVSGSNTVWTNSQTINGLNVYIEFKLRFWPPYTGAVGVNTTTPGTSLTAVEYTPVLAGAGNGTSIYWSFSPSQNYSGTVYVINSTQGAVEIDSFSLNVSAAPPKIVGDWSTIYSYEYVDFNQNYTLYGATNQVTISNIGAGGHVLTFNINNNVPSGGLGMLITRNGSTIIGGKIEGGTTERSKSVTVYNGDVVWFDTARSGRGPYNYSATVTIVDSTAGVTIDSFAISLVAEVNGT